MSDVLVSRCVCLRPCQSPGHSFRPVLPALPGPENTPFPIGISRHVDRAAMYPRKRVSRSGPLPLPLPGRLPKGGGREGEGGEKHVVYPVMADTRTGRCNSRRQHTYSKTLEKAHGYPSLPYHHTGEYPRQCNPPFLVPPRQNPWLFLPCRSGRSFMPRFMPDPDIVDREVSVAATA